MKFKKLTAVTLIIITLLSALALTGTAEEQKDKGAIPESIPTESVNLDIEYGVYVAVKPFDGNSSFAVAPFSRFSVSEDGSRVVLTFPSDSGTAVAVFSLANGTMELVRGFDIALSETAIPRIYGDSVTVWLKESGVLFTIDSQNNLAEIRKLIKDTSSENNETPVSAAEAFFGDGVSEITAENGARFTPAQPLTSDETEIYTKLIMTTADGSETMLYDSSSIPDLRTPTVVILAVIAFAIAIAVAATEIAYLKKKRIDSDKDSM